MSAVVTDHPARQRLELATPAGTAFIRYRREGDTLHLDHAEVPAELAGQGLGSRLVRESLELIRARGERVVPHCSFIRHYIERHAEYAGLCAR